MHNLLKCTSKPVRRLREIGMTLNEARIAVEYLMDTDPDNDILNLRNITNDRASRELGAAIHELNESQDFKTYKFRRLFK